MALYRKKVLTHAERFDPRATGEGIDDMFLFSHPKPQFRFKGDEGFSWQVLDTLHDTWISLEPGDYVARGTKGEYYPIRAAVFEEMYEIVGGK